MIKQYKLSNIKNKYIPSNLIVNETIIVTNKNNTHLSVNFEGHEPFKVLLYFISLF